MAFIWRGYISLLQRHTLLTQMATGGVTSALGDIIYQQGIEKRGWSNHEMYRTRRLVVWGSCCFAPVANRWHAILNSISVGGRWGTVGARTLADQIFFAPVATSLFYLCQGTMESRPWRSKGELQGMRERLEERLWPTVQIQWCVWGPAQIVNFAAMPVYARPPFMNLVAIGWSTFLAREQNRAAAGAGSARPGRGEESIAVIAAEVME